MLGIFQPSIGSKRDKLNSWVKLTTKCLYFDPTMIFGPAWVNLQYTPQLGLSFFDPALS